MNFPLCASNLFIYAGSEVQDLCFVLFQEELWVVCTEFAPV